jgi:hypothetical protein
MEVSNPWGYPKSSKIGSCYYLNLCFFVGFPILIMYIEVTSLANGTPVTWQGKKKAWKGRGGCQKRRSKAS